MNTISRIIILGTLTTLLGACSSGGSSSSGSGGGSNQDASRCVSRTLNEVYVNECDFDINAIVFQANAKPFLINANNASTQSSGGGSFGACRAPSVPVLNAGNTGFKCQ